MDTGSAQFQDLAARGFKGREVELTFAVVTQTGLRALPGLHAVGADHAAAGGVFHDQVVTDLVETVGVQPGVVGLDQALVQFHVEDFEAQRLRGLHLGSAASHADPVGRFGTCCARWRDGGGGVEQRGGHG